ncbi:MAG: N-acetylmuramoyl-L-alanine amidase [Alphaproteobacteria bacterium]
MAFDVGATGSAGCLVHSVRRTLPGAPVRRWIALLSLVVLGWALHLDVARAADSSRGATPVVRDVAFLDRDIVTRVVLTLSDPVDPEIFSLADDYRLVIDLPEVTWAVPGGPRLTGLKAVAGLRYARNRPGRSRVVLDLSGPVSIADRILRERDGVFEVILDLKQTSREAFMRTAGWPARHLLAAGLTDMGPSDAPDPASLRAGFDPAAVAGLPAEVAPSRARRPKRAGTALRTIVLDPGHGGHDPGAIGLTGIYEKAVALAMGLELRERLERTGRYEVRMTRTKDVFVTLPDRVAFARDSQADLFISIHADSNPSKLVRGTSVYTLSERASDTAAARLAQKENSINGLKNQQVTDDVLKILIELAQRDTMNNSVRFAQTLLPALRRQDIGLLRNTHRFGPFWVLTAADVPSVLLEMGFLSNAADEKLVASKAWREKLAAGMVQSLDNYFGFSELASLPATVPARP